ncbi:energy transducer TonB [Siccationidurans ginsengisoli]|uniref:energy transducer TonB n=1 Tax=Hymenobacter TaxID=89966 RepID=UPI001AAD0ACD|nr:energy transducer TonB [Hymenobacter sp. BT559]MBO2032009.1 energy transducer TonB [Hymenobacter sp. BT559]
MFISTRHCFCTLFLLIVCLLFINEVQAQKLRDTKYEKGFLAKGQKTGVWEYYGYTPSGEKVVLQRYDYDQHRLLYFRPGPDITCHTEVSPGKWSYVRPDQPPLFIGSEVALAEYTSRMVYPPAAQAQNIQGKVVVSFMIDTLGHLSNYRLVQRIGGGCDEEALRVARTLPEQWVPARMGRRAVAVEYELPLNFRLAQP